MTVQNRLFLGEAQLAAGDFPAARATLTADFEAARTQYGPDSPWTLKTRLALARLAAAEGRNSDAQTQLQDIIPALRSGGAQTVSELEQALLALQSAQLAKQPGTGLEPVPLHRP